MIDSLVRPGRRGWPRSIPATGRRTIELGRAFANEFPIRVVCQVLGFPDEARESFFYWYHSMMNGPRRLARRTSRAWRPARTSRTTSRASSSRAPQASRRTSTTTHGQPDRARTSSPSCATPRSTATCCRPRRSRRTSRWWSAAAARRPVAPSSTSGTCCCSTPTSSPPCSPTRRCGTRRSTRRCATPPRSAASPATTPSTSSSTACTIPAGSLVNMVDFSANHDERIVPRSRDVRHLPRRPLHAARSCAAATTRKAGAATWPSASGRTCARGRGSRTRSRCVGSKIIAGASANPQHRRRADAEGHRRREPRPDRPRRDPGAVARLRAGLTVGPMSHVTTQNPELAIDQAEAGYRTYEVYQRERVGSVHDAAQARPAALSPEFTPDPYPLARRSCASTTPATATGPATRSGSRGTTTSRRCSPTTPTSRPGPERRFYAPEA